MLVTEEDRVLAWFSGYLKERHLQIKTASAFPNKILPLPTRKIFNLAIIKKERIQRGNIDDDYIRMTVRGQVDNVLLEKTPIEMENIFKSIEGEKKVVLIDGAPGSGKSTLTVHICQRWGKGELFQEFTIVILVQLRDPRVQEARSIAELLPCPDLEKAHQVSSAIKANNGRGILWVMDGWDELSSHKRNESFLREIIHPSQISSIPLSSVIVTSRPISSSDLTELVSSRVEVLGFTSEEQRQYFTECLGGNTKAVDDLMARLSENPAIEGSCSLPLNASIVAHLYLSNGSLPTTVHDIFYSFTHHILSRYFCEWHKKIEEPAPIFSIHFDNLPPVLQDAFNEMCKIAFIGTTENKVTFSDSDLEASKDSAIICKMGLLQATPSIVSNGKVIYYHFIHLSLQEYLSAQYIARMPASEQISTFDSLFSDSRFSSVFQFYSAITKLRTSRPLLSKLPHRLRPDQAGVLDLVRKIIKKKTKKSSGEPKSLLVALLNCLFEAQDPFLCQFVIKQLKNVLNLSDTSLTSVDCLATGYFISISLTTANAQEFTVDLNSCSLGDTGIKNLICSIGKHINPDSSVNTHLNMWLWNNNIREEGASHIADLLDNTNVVGTLSLYVNPIGDKGLQTIFNALKHNTTLKILNIANCRLTDIGLASLADALNKNSTLERLDIRGNVKISDEGLTCLVEVLSWTSGLIELVIPRNLGIDTMKKTINKARQTTGLAAIEVCGKSLD